ncbi:hypothetical protein RJ639_020959 [Escallonia herrerae]|uniref:acylphosphatase n=1 Tax=Escallonia herrerae TaxID=1293975 RepID=A0AA88V2N8_9ASTE|nr:hypothetical protein RJ639_020959 [Escallonia herrerae]
MSSLDSSPNSAPTKTVRVVIKGRVQGVFYRNWTIDNATDLGLKGWVRNRRDGSVEALFLGDSAKDADFGITESVEPRLDDGHPWDVKAGHFVVHTVNDGEAKRFIIALNFLAHPGFLKLLDQAEEEFGFKQEGVLTVPCGPSELQRILKT